MADRHLVLMFHGIGEAPAWVGAAERPFWVSESALESVLDEIDALQSRGVKVELTFDDGNETDVRVALPALLRRGRTAHFFVCAGWMGRPNYVDAGHVRLLRDSGMRVGSHGWDHPNWRTVDDDTLDKELGQARDVLADVLGQPVDDVAIPFGFYDRRVYRALRHHGYRSVYSSNQGRARGTWMVPRVAWQDGWTGMTLRTIAASPDLLPRRSLWAAKRLVKRLR